MKKKKLVIVDDDEELLTELQDILIDNNYDVTVFSNPEHALKKIPLIEPDLIILDLKMGELTGIQLASLIKLSSNFSPVNIMMMSGFYNENDIKEAMKIINIKKFFKKPINPDELLNELNKHFIKTSSV